MTAETPKSGQSMSRLEFERQVILRAQSDPEFRRQLLANPKEALQTAFGAEIPPEVEIDVLQETPTRLYLVLPPPADELTDEQLAAVAGGTGMPEATAADFTGFRFTSAALRMR